MQEITKTYTVTRADTQAIFFEHLFVIPRGKNRIRPGIFTKIVLVVFGMGCIVAGINTMFKQFEFEWLPLLAVILLFSSVLITFLQYLFLSRRWHKQVEVLAKYLN